MTNQIDSRGRVKVPDRYKKYYAGVNESNRLFLLSENCMDHLAQSLNTGQVLPKRSTRDRLRTLSHTFILRTADGQSRAQIPEHMLTQANLSYGYKVKVEGDSEAFYLVRE